jgi:hypothetical protein
VNAERQIGRFQRPIVAEIGAVCSFRIQFLSARLELHTRSACGLGNVRLLRGLGISQMEPTMISLKVLSTAAAIALALPLIAPGESFAQQRHVIGGAPAGGGGAAARPMVGGGAPAGGGAFSRGGAQFSGGAVSRPTFGGGAVSRPTISGGGVTTGPRYSGGYTGGGYRGGYYRHGYRGGGFIPGAVAGAAIGGALASSYGYYDPGYYGGYGDYYDDGYYDQGAVAAAPPPGDDSVAYCMQRYKSYDPSSGTYLGYDGQRHPCP